MELIDKDNKSSTVHQLLQENSPKGWPLLIAEWTSYSYVCVDIVEAVKNMHSKSYLHCDLVILNNNFF